MRNVVYPWGSVAVTLTASQKIAIYTMGKAELIQVTSYANLPATQSLVSYVSAGEYTSGAYLSGGSFIINNLGPALVYYEIGTGPVMQINRGQVTQGDPNTLNATGTLTAAMVLGGIVTSTTAAAVTATLDTGTIMDAASSFAVGDAILWSVINTGATYAFTVTASTGHTVVGAGAVAASTSGRFMTRKTAANTFVTYRVGGS